MDLHFMVTLLLFPLLTLSAAEMNEDAESQKEARNEVSEEGFGSGILHLLSETRSSNSTLLGGPNDPDNPHYEDKGSNNTVIENPSGEDTGSNNTAPGNPSDEDTGSNNTAPGSPSDEGTGSNNTAPGSPSDEGTGSNNTAPGSPSDEDTGSNNTTPGNPSDEDTGYYNTTAGNPNGDNTGFNNTETGDNTGVTSAEPPHFLDTTTASTPSSSDSPSTGPPGNVPDTNNSLVRSEDNQDMGSMGGMSRIANKKAWAAILGTAIVVGCVVLVLFMLLKKRNRQDFMHRKLEEDFNMEPVLRLDNFEPLKIGNMAYDNPGLQGDSI
uniref:Uncharacterized protein n=1 Tax=Scleropages formosus TaxID=113540 RepID=A0A8C9W793_SCLFO